MEINSSQKPDAGQQYRRGRRLRRILVSLCRVLRHRNTFLTALWVATVIVKVWKLLREFFGGS
jgi:hypothetical protein